MEDVDFDGTTRIGALMNRHDWSTAALPGPERWPQRLWALVDLMLASPMPAFIAWGPELGVLYNDASIPLVGGRHPLLLGSPLSVAWPDLWDDIRPLVDRVLDGEPIHVENQRLTLHRDAGEADIEAWFHLSYTPIRDGHGKVQGVYCTLQDTTHQVLAERQRTLSLARLQQLFDQAPGFMAVTRGPEHRFELANDAYLRLAGNRDVVGLPVREAFPEVSAQGYLALLDDVYRSGKAFVGRRMQVRLRHPDGGEEEHYVDFVYQPVRAADGSVGGIFIQGSDVTEQARLERELLRSEAHRKDDFLAMLAHELRNPLAPIRSAAAVLSSAAGDAKRTTQLAQVIARQVQHMTRLVDDLLEVSRVTRGLVKLDFHPDDLKAVAVSAIEQVRPLIEERRHALTTSMVPGRVPVQADRTRLVQVIANLLNNAAKYTPSGGRIELHVTTDGNEAVLVVRDNGNGIDAQLLPRVFDLFTQGARDPDRSQGGLGIGLALARSIALMHGGQLVAASEGRGSGSEFTMRLPLSKPDPTTVAPATEQLGEQARNRCHVIVVDDNIDAARTIALALEIAGHEVIVHHDAAAVLAASAVHPAQVYIIDIGLPDMPGYELAQALRREPRTQHAILIALTGYGRAEDRARSTEAGFDRHLVKPVDVEELRRIIDGLADCQPLA